MERSHITFMPVATPSKKPATVNQGSVSNLVSSHLPPKYPKATDAATVVAMFIASLNDLTQFLLAFAIPHS
jgi:hypothetical protein